MNVYKLTWSWRLRLYTPRHVNRISLLGRPERYSSSGVTRDSGAPRQIFKWGPPFFVIIFIIHAIPHDIRVELKLKLKFIGVCCFNAATKHSMVWIVMPTFYCNYFFAWNLGAHYTRGPPGLCLPCLPHCYATGWRSPLSKQSLLLLLIVFFCISLPQRYLHVYAPSFLVFRTRL